MTTRAEAATAHGERMRAVLTIKLSRRDADRLSRVVRFMAAGYAKEMVWLPQPTLNRIYVAIQNATVQS